MKPSILLIVPCLLVVKMMIELRIGYCMIPVGGRENHSMVEISLRIGTVVMVPIFEAVLG